MQLRPLFVFATLSLAAVASRADAAASRAASAASMPPHLHGLVVRQAPQPVRERDSVARTPDKRSAGAATARSAAAAHRLERRQTARLMLREASERQHEQAQVDARARRIYAVSQTSAPILADTRACKRTGPHGESVYENCALAGAGAASR